MMRGNNFVLILLFFFRMQVREAQNTDVKVGIVTDVGRENSDITLLCISMSLSDFYSSHPETRTRLITTIVDSKNDVVLSAAAALDLITNKEVKAILGPWTWMQAQFMIEMGQKSQVPTVSYSATSPFLASIRSQYFFGATYDDSSQVHAIKAIIELFMWREVAPAYVDNTFGEGILPSLTNALQEINVRIPYRTVIYPNATDDEISVELLRMMNLPTRVFVVHIAKLLGSRFFAKAKEIGMMKQGYVWILTNSIADDLSIMNETEIETMEGVLGVKTYFPRSEELETFKSRWKKRFPNSDLSVYGLCAYDATTALALAIEEAGTSNLTFVKTDAMRDMSELQGLGVSQYGPKLVQALSRVRFKALAGDFQFINGQLHPSVFEIVNVDGRGGRTIGFWKKEHGLLKNLEQKPATTTTSSTWQDRLRPIIWPGDTMSVPKGWEIPTNGKRLRIGVPTNNGFKQFVKATRDPITNSTIFSGFCIDYFEAVIQAMSYDVSYDFIPFEDVNYDTAIYQVYLGLEYDAMVADTTMSANRSMYVDFSLPYTPSGIGVVVPVEESVKRSSIIFLTPLTLELWVISLLSFFIIGLVVWVLEHRVNPDFDGSVKYQISTIFWFSFSIIAFAPRERVLSFWARLVVIIWYFLVLVLTQSYTASLSSLLTSQQLDSTITSMNSLLAKGEPVGYQLSSFLLGRLQESGFSDANLVTYGSAENCDDLLSKGPQKGGISAAFMEVPYVKLFLGQYCNKYKMVETPFKFNGLGFVFPIGSPLVADVSRAILQVQESNKRLPLRFTRVNGINKAGKKITLMGQDGVNWMVLLTNENERGRMRLGRGWKGFCEAHGVKIGDSFVLELMREKDSSHVLKFCTKLNCV
ncbi:PREDICTED: glutamate receptor 2.1-like [Brassica oleracea var. oleracea]|nr:PREDICTED: glutamate receptor 2.1-like [Brassica oleracea var. oleracea]